MMRIFVTGRGIFYLSKRKSVSINAGGKLLEVIGDFYFQTNMSKKEKSSIKIGIEKYLHI